VAVESASKILRLQNDFLEMRDVVAQSKASAHANYLKRLEGDATKSAANITSVERGSIESTAAILRLEDVFAHVMQEKPPLSSQAHKTEDALASVTQETANLEAQYPTSLTRPDDYKVVVEGM
jgi:hypothetical protein